MSTLRVLVTQPGRLSTEWSVGRRARYLAPLKLFVFCSLVYIATGAVYDGAKAWLVDPETIEHSDSRDRLRGTIMEPKIDAVDGYLHAMMDLGTRWSFFLMPVGGFGLYVLYGHRRRTYGAHFVVAVHVFAGVMLILGVRRVVQVAAVLIPPHMRLADSAPTVNDVVFWGALAASVVYAAASIRRYYGVGWVKAVASSPAVIVAPLLVWIVLLTVGMFVIMLT